MHLGLGEQVLRLDLGLTLIILGLQFSMLLVTALGFIILGL